MSISPTKREGFTRSLLTVGDAGEILSPYGRLLALPFAATRTRYVRAATMLGGAARVRRRM